MFAALAKGDSTVHHALLGEDCISTMHCMQALGADCRIVPGAVATIAISSPGMAAFCRHPVQLDCGNSGTSSRLLMGIVASLPQVNATFYGDESLSSRPMGRVLEPLQALGADISYLAKPGYLPVCIRGRRLHPGDLTLDKASAQVKSALLLAGLNIGGMLRLDLPAGSRDHTEKILVGMGASLKTDLGGGREKIVLHGPFAPVPGDYTIPVDPSSAAFFAVLGLLRPRGETLLPHVLDNPSRTGFVKVLERMTGSSGALQRKAGGAGYVEPVMDIVVQGGCVLHATDIAPAEVPTLVDEIPVLAVAAMFARGRSRFAGLSELKVKESDRLAKTCELLRLAGAAAAVDGDDLIIEGPVARVPFFSFDPLGDHRLAMAAAVLARASHEGAEILGPACVAVSFPDFFKELAKVT